MSGIEIAGLALGAFPLLIAVLEHWRKCAEIAGDWWSIRSEVTRCTHDLQCAELALRRNLEKLLLPLIAVDDDKVQELMSNPEGEAWKDEELERNLEKRLPEAYHLFKTTVGEINALLAGLRRELGIDTRGFTEMINARENTKERNFRLSVTNFRNIMGKIKKARLEAHFQRLKFAFGRTDRSKLFTDLNRYNNTLRDLLTTTEEVTTLQQARKSTKASFAIEKLCSLWKHACSLYDLLTKAICCPCKDMHALQLRLRHQVHVVKVEFHLCLLYHNHAQLSNTVEGDMPWAAKHIRAQKKDLETQSLMIPAFENEATQTFSSARHLLQSALRPSLTNTSSSATTLTSQISLTKPHVESGLEVVDTETLPTDPSTVDDPNSSIHDLCAAITNSSEPMNCLGDLRKEDTLFSLFSMQDQNRPFRLISLSNLLCQGSQFKLSRRDRYSLALTIASSHLQLSSSGWIGPGWTKDDILFQLPSNGPPQQSCLWEPYISRSLANANPSPESNYMSTDCSLQTLGILLIELCHGETLEQQEMRQHYAPMNEAHRPEAADLQAKLDLAVALQWAESVLGEGGERFAQAVDWCLRSRAPDSAVNDARWRRDIFANVVEPLQFCSDAMNAN